MVWRVLDAECNFAIQVRSRIDGKVKTEYLLDIDFRTCVLMILRKEHTSLKGRAICQFLKDGMNSTRTIYTWDYLSRLPKY